MEVVVLVGSVYQGVVERRLGQRRAESGATCFWRLGSGKDGAVRP